MKTFLREMQEKIGEIWQDGKADGKSVNYRNIPNLNHWVICVFCPKYEIIFWYFSLRMQYLCLKPILYNGNLVRTTNTGQ